MRRRRGGGLAAGPALALALALVGLLLAGGAFAEEADGEKGRTRDADAPAGEAEGKEGRARDADAPAGTTEKEDPFEDEMPIYLWPVLESRKLKSGAWRKSLVGLWHTTRLPPDAPGAKGKLYSWHIFPYFQGPDYKVFFPLGYSFGPEGKRRSGFVPFYFQGTDYKTSPPLLSMWLRHSDDSDSTWITPFFHVTREPSGKVRDFHFANYFQGPNYKVFAPLGYSIDRPGGKYRGFIPFYFEGPRYRIAPPLLSGRWKHDDGTESTWITPLFHKTVEADGSLRHMHAFNYFQGPGYKVLFPFGYKIGERAAVFPFYFQGPGYKVLFPLAYKTAEHAAVIPFYFRGPNYKVSPVFLSGQYTHADGGKSTWITPFFHKTTNADGTVRHMHCLNYLQGTNYKLFLPIGYSVGAPGRRHKGVFPFAFWGPDYMVAPLLMPFYVRTRAGVALPVLLSGRWRSEDGSQTTLATPLFHKTTNADGTVRHMHCLNYLQGTNYKLFLPLGYSVGPPGNRHSGFVPFYFQAPNYSVIPPLLSGRWRHSDGSESTWITPFFHKTVEVDGSLRHMHAFNYFQGTNYKLFVPLGYSVGPPGNRHSGVIPFYFQGPTYKIAPPLLSARRSNDDGSATTWITPLFHATGEPGGGVRDWHLANYFRGPNYKVFFPLGYSVGEPGQRHQGVVPLFFRGPGYGIIPPLLSARRKNEDDDSTTAWMTPFFHRTLSAGGGVRDSHFANYFQGPNYKVLFPLAYSAGEPGQKHRGVVPLYFGGPGYQVLPPLLSARREHDDVSTSTWITPFFHVRRDPGGQVLDWHLANYFRGPNYKLFAPLGYSLGPPGERHSGFIPLYFQGPRYKVIPLLLSGRWRHADDAESTWITPLFHRTKNPDGSLRHMHLLNYFQGENYKVFFPLAYRTPDYAGVIPLYFRGPGYKVLFPLVYKIGERTAVVPFYFQGPDYKVIPPLLSGRWQHSDGAQSTWITPLFHKTVEADGALRHMHALNYFQGPDYKVFFPLAYTTPDYAGVIPFYFRGPGYKVSPPLLSGRWQHSDGAQSTWITPLFHKTVEADGSLRHMHALNYFQGPNYKILYPFVYKIGDRAAVPPFYFQGRDYKVAPLLLSGRWRHADDSASTWITPFYHRTVDRDGEFRHMHFLNYLQGRGYKILFPFAYKIGERAGVLPFYFQGPGYKVSPAFLSGKWQHSDGAQSTWITPFFHKTVEADGALRHMHLLTYFQGPGYKVLFPFAYKTAEHAGVVPFYFRGPGYKVSPAFLSGKWQHSDGAQSTWITPFFHKTVEADGSLRHMHALTYFQGPGYKVLFPFAYKTAEHAGVVPFYFQGPGYKVSPLLLSGQWQHSDGAQSTWITPFFHKTVEAGGSLRHMHALNYFQGPGYKLFLPFGYSLGRPGLKHSGVVPFYFQGPDYRLIPPLLSGRWRHSDGSESTWITPFSHTRRNPDGSLRHMHCFNYFQGESYKILFPFGYSVGEVDKHQGVVPFYFGGPGYRIIPPLLTARRQHEDGSATTWVTPFFHQTRDAAGSLRHMHALNYFQGENYKVFFPLGYSFGPPENRHSGFVPVYFRGPRYRILYPFGYKIGERAAVFPFYFQGRDYKVVPPLLSGRWRHSDGAESTWITPLFHATRDADGSLRHAHFLNYFQGPNYKTFFPLYWQWRRKDGTTRSLIPPLYLGQKSADGEEVYRSVPPLLFGYHRGPILDSSGQFQAWPFSYQRAGEDFEFNFLWRLFSNRREAGARRTMWGPLWYSRRPQPGVPKEFLVLGGVLAARDCNYRRKRYRYRILGIIPMGGWKHFKEAPAITSAAPADATVGMVYSHTLTATGHPKRFRWKVTAGTLPTGLSLNRSTGVLAGTPTASGTWSGITVECLNRVNPPATQTFAITVAKGQAPLKVRPAPTGVGEGGAAE